MIGPSPRRLDLTHLPELGRGTVLRDGGDAVLLSYGPVMLNEALVAAENLAERGALAVRVIAMPWLNRLDDAWLAAEFGRSSTSSSSRTTRRSAAWATASAPRSQAVSSPSSASRAGPRAGRPTRRSASTASTAHRSRRGSPQPPVAGREPPRPPLDDQAGLGRPPDLLSIRVFFDTGIATGLHERLGGRLAAVFLVPRDAAAEWLDRVPGLDVLHGDDLTTGDGLPDRAFARVDATLDRQLGYHPLAIRLNRRYGFHTERMQPGHPNWMLDTNRDSRLPHRPPVERAMERWFFSPRRHVPRRLLEAMRRDCSGLLLSNVQPMNAVPFLTAARRLRLPVVAHVASWDHTVGKGVISPHCDLYVVQNRVMEDDLRRYHGIAPERVRVTGWPQTDLFHRIRPRAEYEALLRRYGLDPAAPSWSSAGTRRATRPTRGGSSSASSRGGIAPRASASSFSSGPTRATPAGRSASRRSGARGHRACRRRATRTSRSSRRCSSMRTSSSATRARSSSTRSWETGRPSASSTTRERRPGESWAAKNVVGKHYQELAASGAFYRAERFDEVVAGIERALERPDELAAATAASRRAGGRRRGRPRGRARGRRGGERARG